MAKLETKGLDKIIKALKNSKPRIVVGILGAKGSAVHEGEGSQGPTVAEVGAAHEYGTTTLPQRSFLRVPLADNFNKALKASGLLDKDTLKEVIATGTLIPWLKKGAIVAEGVVLEAFDTAGNGEWPPSNMQHKKVHQTLIETRQLVSSITAEVRDKS